MLFDPVVTLVLFVGEHGGGRFFPETGCDGEAAGAGADDDYVVYFGVCRHLNYGLDD
jgi:hypothetical protein